jgi:beta-glucosidase
MIHSQPYNLLKPNMQFNYINRNDFIEYAELCYREFGDRVKHWITLNEPLTFTSLGYAYGSFPPGRCSKWLPLICGGGDSGTEPYVVAHHQILAHAAAVNVYRDKYQVLSCC